METISQKRDAELRHLNSLDRDYTDPFPTIHGVLLSDQIRELAQRHSLIDPFDDKNLKSAGYELTIGDEFYVGGVYHDFSQSGMSDTLVLPPFEVAVIKTAERVCLPRFLIARWNLRVRYAYRGLLWVGAAQVDPGYAGYLFCPIYNLSHKSVALPRGEQIALIDFVKTTPYRRDMCVRYPSNKRPIIQDFGVEGLQSALFHEVGNRLESFEDAIRQVENKLAIFITITLTTLAILTSAAATIYVQGKEFLIFSGIVGPAFVFISFLSLTLSILALCAQRTLKYLRARAINLLASRAIEFRRTLRRNWLIGFVTSLAIAILTAASVAYVFKQQVGNRIDSVSKSLPSNADLSNLDKRLSEKITQLNGVVGSQVLELKNQLQRERDDLDGRIRTLEKLRDGGSKEEH